MKLGIISLGCAKNLYDSEMILGILKKNNVEIVNNTKEADVILINTCGFIESAKEEAINTIFEMLELKKRYNKKIVVTGCLVERYLDTLKEEIPEVDLFIPIHSYKDFGKIFSELFNVKMDDNERKLLHEGGIYYVKIIRKIHPERAYITSDPAFRACGTADHLRLHKHRIHQNRRH